MKTIRKTFILFLTCFLFLYSLSAKETQIAKDVKKALRNYAGLSELKKRGFELNSIDTAESLEEVHKAMLPYMIVDGISLDNAICFYDKANRQTYNFKRHYNIHFSEDYGTKDQLLKKGYKEEEIFPYYSRGKDIYRGGTFSWGPQKKFIELSRWLLPKCPPVTDDSYIYFFYPYYTEKFYPDYWKQAVSKDFIIIDMRFNQNGEYPVSQFFDYLDQKRYKGQVILIIDSTSYTGEWLLSYRMTTWKDGVESPRKFKYTTVGENTLGFGNFTGQWQRFENDRNTTWGVQPQINQWKKIDEGVGFMPDIWADTPEDIFKTVEIIIGKEDFSSKVSIYQDFIDQRIIQNEKDIFFPRPSENVSKTEDDFEYLNYLSEYLRLQKKWQDFYLENYDKRSVIKSSLLNKFGGNSSQLSLEQYISQLDKTIDDSIIRSIKEINDLKGDDYIQLLGSKLTFKEDVPKPNRDLESVFTIFNKLEILQKEGFDLHKMDYMKTPEEIIGYLQPYFLSLEGYPRDLHTHIDISTNNRKNYSVRQNSRYIVFNDEYGTKEQLLRKGYVEDVTMFYYPYHDGKFWKNEKNWRTGRQIMAFPNYNTYRQTEWALKYYTTDKSVYFKFRNFPHPVKHEDGTFGPEIQDPELQKMIEKLAKETGKENVIFDVSKNTGGDGYTSNKISEAVKASGIKNVYIVIDKGAFSCGDHFPLESKTYLFKNQNVTLVGYPTMGGTGSGDGETYIIDFPDFQVTAEIATSFTQSETEHEGWGATPDVYADNMEDALGAVRALTGDMDIQPFETEESKQYNKGKLRWLDKDTIYEIK